jgi:RNA polymerase sigma-70 factor (ECF subfamily)
LKDEAHIVRYLKSNQIALAVTAISEQYHEVLYWHIRKLVKQHDLADDVLQNTYLRIFKGLKGFGFKSSIKTWCYRIAYNESMRELQKNQAFKKAATHTESKDYFATLTADPYFDLDSVSHAFHESLLALPEKQQQIFQMKYFDELTFEEIARITSWNINSIKTGFYAAKEKIKHKLTATV